MPLALRPLSGGLGVEVNCDLSAPRQQPLVSDLGEALARHRVLVFPRQHLNHADLLRVSAYFGTVDTDVDRRYAVGGFPGITTVSNIVEDGSYVGIYDGDDEEEWHVDNSFKPELTRATLLYSVITPEHGGQTRFADATRAYAELPQDLKERIEGLRAIHSIQQLSTLQSQASGGTSSAAAGSFADQPEVEHPLVQTHPVTGARSLLLGPMVIRGIVGMAAEESRSLLAKLLEHATSPRYVYSHRWRQGDLIVWDNLATLHTASSCDSSRHHRLLYRTAVR
ncbi:TauD/TfdA dioxygenase family protein [Streptomyces violens]|uniref:TauD/TfdA dioxygenase family protein n=1 Tax=Streptomyces violens TaxID=66377 RepID=UPI0004C1D26A|nr:TauD/TfdA family dioxygenase [Streptomyces violens]